MNHKSWTLAMNVGRAVLLATLVVVPYGCGRSFDGPPAPEVTEVRGSVSTDVGVPVAGARIRLMECGLAAQTDDLGEFTISAVPNGSYTVRARLEGYAEAVEDVELAGTAEVKLVLRKSR